MEVHHHSHTERKKWTHYFWEFLMLFLAVTLGFLVENQREHYVEHFREKQYVKSLYDDFKVDTFTIQRTYKEKKWALAKLDSLQEILRSGEIEKNNELVYYFEKFLTIKDVFTSQDVTYKQLLSSGNLRYFKDLDLYKKIANYYNLYSRYQELAEGAFGNVSELAEVESNLFDAGDLNSLNDSSGAIFYGLIKRPYRKFHLINIDRKNLNFLLIKTGNVYYATNASAKFLVWLKKYADEIVDFIKKEYHLE